MKFAKIYVSKCLNISQNSSDTVEKIYLEV